MKKLWVCAEPWNKNIVVSAIESGADAVVIPKGYSSKVEKLGVITTVAPDGDRKIGKDVIFVEISNADDLEEAMKKPSEATLVLKMLDWSIIPLENLIAQRSDLFLQVTNASDAKTALQILEKGVNGVVLCTSDISEIHKTADVVHGIMPKLEMQAVTITEVKLLGMCDRVCIDTGSLISPGEGMLIGSSCDTFFLVQSETEDNSYVGTRPFRVNAGPVHSYLLGADKKTKYLSDLMSGMSVMSVNHTGNTREIFVGRCKIEKRPHLLIVADCDGERKTIILQNAETVKLIQPDGKAIAVTSLKAGDDVLVHREVGGRHFGMSIEETLIEK